MSTLIYIERKVDRLVDPDGTGEEPGRKENPVIRAALPPRSDGKR